jgi:hypothetical protein
MDTVTAAFQRAGPLDASTPYRQYLSAIGRPALDAIAAAAVEAGRGARAGAAKKLAAVQAAAEVLCRLQPPINSQLRTFVQASHAAVGCVCWGRPGPLLLAANRAEAHRHRLLAWLRCPCTRPCRSTCSWTREQALRPPQRPALASWPSCWACSRPFLWCGRATRRPWQGCVAAGPQITPPPLWTACAAYQWHVLRAHARMRHGRGAGGRAVPAGGGTHADAGAVRCPSGGRHSGRCGCTSAHFGTRRGRHQPLSAITP